jgi:Luciferase-like monooxygenase
MIVHPDAPLLRKSARKRRPSKPIVSDILKTLELGLDTFGDVTDGADGHPLAHAQVIRNVIAEAVLADELGIDFFGVGEHHRADFAVSAPEVVLAAIAGQTK